MTTPAEAAHGCCEGGRCLLKGHTELLQDESKPLNSVGSHLNNTMRLNVGRMLEKCGQ